MNEGAGIFVDYTMIPENLSKKRIFLIIWGLGIILSGTFLGTNYSIDWTGYVDPWLKSEKTPHERRV